MKWGGRDLFVGLMCG